MCVWGGKGGRGSLGVVRPNRAAPLLAGRGDPSPRGCPPYATRAGGSQPAARGGLGSGAVGRGLLPLFIVPRFSLKVCGSPDCYFSKFPAQIYVGCGVLVVPVAYIFSVQFSPDLLSGDGREKSM